MAEILKDEHHQSLKYAHTLCYHKQKYASRGEDMERQLPKNVRQIGNVCDEPKIYVEDYVDTYLSQIRMKAIDSPQAAALVGDITEKDGQAVVYISGAIQMKEIEIKGTDIVINEDTKKELEEKQKEYFPSQDIVGWCLVENGHPMSLNRGVNKIHGKMYAKENTVFIWKDSLESDEMFFAYKYGELMQMGGHYIYYEKNPDMQNYMINTRRQNGVTPSEVVEDRAAKDFRSTIREKNAYREQRQSSRLLYVTSILLVIVVLAIGVSTMNNYDKMESVQNTLEILSQSVNRPRDGTEAAEDDAAKEDDAEPVEEDREAAGEEAQVSEAQANEVQVQEAQAQESMSDAPVSEEVRESKEEASGEEEAAEAMANMPNAADTMGQLSENDFYVVKKGDTLDSISIKIYGDRGEVEAICKMNGLSDGNLIFIGQKLLLP